MSAPTVSVVMAAYNGADLIDATVASLRQQSFTDWELIAVDDHSTDGTLLKLRAYDDPRIRVVAAEKNGGPVAARNRAFREARGRYIAGLDQDDLCAPERFARQVAYLDSHPETVLVATAIAELTHGRLGPSQLPPVTTPALIGWLINIQNPLAWSSVMFRADAARAFPEMTDPDMLYAEDFDLYHRLYTKGLIARLDEELLIYRNHAGGASQRYTDTMSANAERVLRRAHTALVGEEPAAQTAPLIVRHVMRRQPVASGDTLREVGDALAMLLGAYIEQVNPKADDRALIRWETARLWGRIGQTALRSGAVGIAAALANRPDHLGLGYAGIDSLMAGRLIGSLRNLKKRPRAN